MEGCCQGGLPRAGGWGDWRKAAEIVLAPGPGMTGGSGRALANKGEKEGGGPKRGIGQRDRARKGTSV